MWFPHVARVLPKSSNASSDWSVLVRGIRWLWFGLLTIAVVVVGYLIHQSRTTDGQARDRDLEVRLDFIPFRPRPEFRDSLAMTLHGDGKVRVIHHRRGTFIDAVYEGTLPQAEAMQFIARARQARSEWVPRVQADNRDSPLFRMVVVAAGSSDEKDVFGGPLDYASENTRNLVEELLVLSTRLNKVPPAEAYVRSMPFVEEELKRMQHIEGLRFLSASELPANLQQPLNESLNRPRDFVPIPRAQYDQLMNYKSFVINHNGFSYSLTLSLPTPAESTNRTP